MKLKRSYSAREVTALTGLTARQLRWWDARQVLPATVASRRTAAGGYTERRYSPVEVYELIAMADLRRRGFSVQKIRVVLAVLRDRFGLRLYEALGDDGKITLLTDGCEVYARTSDGDLFNVLRAPGQPLLAVGSADLEALDSRVQGRRRKASTGGSRPVKKKRALTL